VQIKVEAGTQRPVDGLMTQAVAAQRQGDLEHARQLYERAINIGPVSAPLYNNYGALLNAMGNPRDAIAMLRLALSLDHAFTNAWINLAVAEDASGDHAAAVGALEQALKLDPTNRDSKVNLAEQYLAVGADRDARRVAEDVVKADPNFAPGHYALARALEAQRETSGAVREFSRFLELGGASSRPGFDGIIRAHINALKAAP
jgi:Tfp pilus assembly protein PilF